MPDFCPASNARLPFFSVTRMGEAPKSKSGPSTSGQLVRSGRRQADVYASLARHLAVQRILPVFRSSAMKASLRAVAGSE